MKTKATPKKPRTPRPLKPRTPIEWFKTYHRKGAPWAKTAIKRHLEANGEPFIIAKNSCADALYIAFSWRGTPEGFDYWSSIHRSLP